MQSIRITLQQLEETYKPKITYIIVQKRHHVRFFCENESEGVGEAKNIAPGTTVDTVVTHPTDFDYYQCSQLCMQRTSAPVKYTIARDGTN